MAQFRDTTYVERVRGEVSPEEHFERDAAQIVRTLDVQWDDRSQAIQDFLGDSFVDLETYSQAFVSRTIPNAYVGSSEIEATYLVPVSQVYPAGGAEKTGSNPGTPYLYANAIASVKGIASRGADTVAEVAEYQIARLNINYVTHQYNIIDDLTMQANGYTYNGAPDESTLQRYVTKTYEPGVSSINFPEAQFQYYPSSTAKYTNIPFGIQARVPSINVILTWEEVPAEAVPSQLVNPTLNTDYYIENILGSTNADFADDGMTPVKTFGVYPAGTLLFTAVAMKPWISPIGRYSYTVEYHFQYFAQGQENVLLPQNVASPAGTYAYGQIFSQQPTSPATSWPILPPGMTGAPSDGVLLYNVRPFNVLFRPPWSA